MTILISNKTAFNIKHITRDNVGNFYNEKSIHEKDITIINIYIPTIEYQNTWNKIEKFEEKVENSTIIESDFNTTLWIMDRTTR